MAVQEVERGGPGRIAEALHRRARGPGVAEADELGLRVPGEAGEVGVDVGRRGGWGGSQLGHRRAIGHRAMVAAVEGTGRTVARVTRVMAPSRWA